MIFLWLVSEIGGAGGRYRVRKLFSQENRDTCQREREEKKEKRKKEIGNRSLAYKQTFIDKNHRL